MNNKRKNQLLATCPLPLGLQPNPYDLSPGAIDAIERSCNTFAVGEMRGEDLYLTFVTVDPNNPDCVIDIPFLESGAENKQAGIRDNRGYVGYIRDNKLFINKQISFTQSLKPYIVHGSKLMGIWRIMITKVSVILKNIRSIYTKV